MEKSIEELQQAFQVLDARQMEIHRFIDAALAESQSLSIAKAAILAVIESKRIIKAGSN